MNSMPKTHAARLAYVVEMGRAITMIKLISTVTDDSLIVMQSAMEALIPIIKKDPNYDDATVKMLVAAEDRVRRDVRRRNEERLAARAKMNAPAAPSREGKPKTAVPSGFAPNYPGAVTGLGSVQRRRVA